MNKDTKRLLETVNHDNFWESLIEVSKQIPNLNIGSSELVKFLQQVIDRIGNDGGVHYLNEGMLLWSEKNPTEARLALDLLTNSNHPRMVTFIPPVAAGVSKTDQRNDVLKELLQLIKDKKKCVLGIMSVIRIEYDAPDKWFLDSLEEEFNLIVEKNDLTMFPHLIDVYGRLNQHFSNAKDHLIQFSKINVLEIRLALLYYLWINAKYHDAPEHYRTLLLEMTKGEHLQNERCKSTLTPVLTKTIELNTKLTAEFLDLYIRQNPEHEISIFKNILQQLYSKDNSQLQHLLTCWLNEDKPFFHRAVSEVHSQFYISSLHNVGLSKEVIQSLSTIDVQFIILRILSYNYTKEHLQRLVFSLLDCCPGDKEVERMVYDAFVVKILYNYPSSKTFLEEKKKSANRRTVILINRIIKESELYYQELEKLPRLKEFYASPTRAKIYAEKQAKKQNERFAKRDKGLFESFMTHINLKGGKNFFTKSDGKYSDKTPMGHVRASIDLPRGEFIDPIGELKERMTFRIISKPKP